MGSCWPRLARGAQFNQSWNHTRISQMRIYDCFSLVYGMWHSKITGYDRTFSVCTMRNSMSWPPWLPLDLWRTSDFHLRLCRNLRCTSALHCWSDGWTSYLWYLCNCTKMSLTWCTLLGKHRPWDCGSSTPTFLYRIYDCGSTEVSPNTFAPKSSLS